ncbi:U1 zinc finger-domain-containing protein [Podospora appendiculata]|uniref:U1 small nuclear ribonucleoprotein C n=1 Tax=Podospora appendiculata TaxID=314037 RepID=A0AAE0X4N3_9PEZI|nr:U1 zinc finger-domain-containing protein [Podospora appendiculata]
MPKFFCDYCDVYLTHDSMSVRKAHNTGRNHLRNVVDYYQQIGHEKAQSVIDSITSSYAAEGQAHANPMLPQNQPGGIGAGLFPPPGGMGMGMPGMMPPGMPGGMPPPFGFPGGPPPFPGGAPPFGPPGAGGAGAGTAGRGVPPMPPMPHFPGMPGGGGGGGAPGGAPMMPPAGLPFPPPPGGFPFPPPPGGPGGAFPFPPPGGAQGFPGMPMPPFGGPPGQGEKR